ncbi:pilZ domain protein [Collimonas arenae]|uniref:Flagellar brake protein YcgR n=1 Tax=Collimonas arenae TaxID=279058 RepID=A0A127QP68_9BURK|nr:flagellar brake protein [Collimonas arenae]AMP11392.1 pilZ domain protein [Collimonas arenae]
MSKNNLTVEARAELGHVSPLTASLAGLEEFRISYPKTIAHVLRQFARQMDFLNIAFGRHGERTVTRILAVDESSGTFHYDYGATEMENLRLQDSEENLLSGMQSGVHVQFICGRPEPVLYEGLPAFKSQFPESLYRIQRRESFRVETPIANPYICTATLPDSRRVRFEIVDLSLTGIRLRSTDASIGELEIGMTLTGAAFDYRDLGVMESELKITFIHNSQTFSNPIYHLGCRFLTLPKAKEASLQRLITFLELSRNRR